MKTTNESIAAYTAEFRRLARPTQKAHARKARAFIATHPGCADHSSFWRGLSARQVISAASVEGNDAWARRRASTNEGQAKALEWLVGSGMIVPSDMAPLHAAIRQLRSE